MRMTNREAISAVDEWHFYLLHKLTYCDGVEDNNATKNKE
jgi:hypothetical protein